MLNFSWSKFPFSRSLEKVGSVDIWMFPKTGYPKMDGIPTPIQMDDLGVPLFFGNTLICGYQTPGNLRVSSPQKNPKTSTKEFADGLQGAGLQGEAGHRLPETPR